MTFLEAIEIIKDERDNDVFAGTDYRRRVHEAMTMAIEALEILDKICSDHDTAMKQFIADAEKCSGVMI